MMQTYNLSYWEKETFFRQIDLAIIGSGIVGLCAAIHAKKQFPKLNVVIFERGALPAGASTRNAGFACFGSMTELLDDMRVMTQDEVLAVVEKRWAGLQRLRALAGDKNLEFKHWGGYELFSEDDEAVFHTCLERMPEMNARIGAITGNPEVYSVADDRIKTFGFQSIRHLIFNADEGQVHTGKMMDTLIKKARQAGVRIFYGLPVNKLSDGASGVDIQLGEKWNVRAARVLVAVNGFAKNLLKDVDITPARNQVLITKPVPGLKIEGCFHYDRGYYYFRNIDGRILLGGGRHLAMDEEKTEQFGANELIRSALAQLLRQVICPGIPVEIDGWWTGIMGLGPEKKPVIKRVSPNIAVSVRLSGMGVAIGALVGEEGADLALK